MAIIPGVALSQLWKSFQIFESIFTLISYLVIIISFLGLLSGLFIMFNQQQSELSILRSMGARPIQLVSKLILESLIITVLAILLGTLILLVSSLIVEPYFESRTGLILDLFSLTLHDLKLMVIMSLLGAFISLIPAYRSYRASLNEGFSSL